MNTQVHSGSDERTANNSDNANAVRHNYRILSDEEKAQMADLKNAGQAFLDVCDRVAPGGSREMALAKTNAEQAVMWAVKHVTAG